jgi:AcrR family transcriptional regulator
MTSVKRSTSARAAKAAATRARIVERAYELFGAVGYKATTMEEIAKRAGVAVQTVYFLFHTKDDLLQAVHEWAVLGDDPTPPKRQAWSVAAMQEADGRRALRMIVEGIASIEARVAPLIPVYHAVAQDPAGAVFRRSEELRREGMSHVTDALAAKTPLRPSVTPQRAAELLFVLTGPETYRAFVLDVGWTCAQWIDWVAGALEHELFGARTAV